MQGACATAYGFNLRRPADQGTCRQLLVSGHGRSGTSAMASLLKYAGYYLGELGVNVTGEDKSLQKLLREGRHDEILASLADRAQTHPLVAWKEPKLIGGASRKLIAQLPEDWALILMSRDPLAVAMRLELQHGGDIADSFVSLLKGQGKLWETAQSFAPRPVFFVSYEKLMAAPETVAASLLNDLNPEIAATLDVGALWDQMKKDHARYLSS